MRNSPIDGQLAKLISIAVLVTFPSAVIAQSTTSANVPQIPGWGQIIDPKGDCTIGLRGGMLSIRVPGAQHNLNPMPGWQNLDAPRVLQEVDGDFTLSVVASRFPLPPPKSATNKVKPFSMVFSGLLVWQDGNNFLRYARAGNGDRQSVSVQMERFVDGKKAAWVTTNMSDDDTLLYLSRTGDRINTGFRPMSNTLWPESAGFDLGANPDAPLRGRVKVGVFVINSTNREITHEFTQLQLKKL